MYPNDNRYGENMSNIPNMQNMPNMDNLNPAMYNPQMRGSSLDMGGNRAPYYEGSYYDKAPQMMQPMYDYMSQPPMMPMNQGIDPRYSNWRQSSQNRPQIMPSYYDNRPPISESYMHSKPPLSGLPYGETYPSHQHLANTRTPQINILQRISYLIKPQLPQLKKIMLKATSSVTSSKKKESLKRQRSRDRQRERQKERDRSHERNRKSSSTGEWVCGKCSFLNFEWRDKCKKCTESKPSSSSGRHFTPGPEDWKCVKCGNLNYARRVQCNRCKLPKSNNMR